MRLYRNVLPLILSFLALQSVTGCFGEKHNEVLDEKTMINILIDMHYGEAILMNMPIKPPYDSLLKLQRMMEERIYVQHEIDEDTYRRSMKYYSENHERMLQIYKAVHDSIKAFQPKRQ